MTPEPEAEDRATKPRRWPWITGIVAALLFGFGIGAAGSETEPVAAEPEVITETVEVEKIVEPADVKESRERWQELATEQNTREDELDEREAELDEREAELAETEEAEPEPTVVEESDDGTAAQQNALRSAEQYLDYTAFSRSGLIGQLEYEGFSTDDATWAVDNVTVDWDEQAAASAQQYLDYTSFSRSGLIEQLEYEGFTTEQAEYGVNQTGL